MEETVTTIIFRGEIFLNRGNDIKLVSDCRMGVEAVTHDGSKKSMTLKEANFKEYSATSSMLYDSNKDGGDNIRLEDRKRRRRYNKGVRPYGYSFGSRVKCLPE